MCRSERKKSKQRTWVLRAEQWSPGCFCLASLRKWLEPFLVLPLGTEWFLHWPWVDYLAAGNFSSLSVNGGHNVCLHGQLSCKHTVFKAQSHGLSHRASFPWTLLRQWRPNTGTKRAYSFFLHHHSGPVPGTQMEITGAIPGSPFSLSFHISLDL